ncbi:MAG: divalent-cation tolerance protein CutA [Rhodospirillales bacterium]
MSNITDSDKPCLIYVTAADRAEAVALGRELVARRLAACANVLAPTTAIFRWEGEVQEGEEATLIVKSVRARVAEVMTVIKSLHSYELPCILVIDDVIPEPGFGRWIVSETQPEA